MGKMTARLGAEMIGAMEGVGAERTGSLFRF